MTTDFDLLAVEARNIHNRNGQTAFLRAAVELESWYFVGVRPEDSPEEPEPLVAAIDREPHLLVFTDEPRALGFARRRAGAKGGEPLSLCMETADALEYAQWLLDHGVSGLHFNDGEHAVSAPTRRVLDVARQGR